MAAYSPKISICMYIYRMCKFHLKSVDSLYMLGKIHHCIAVVLQDGFYPIISLLLVPWPLIGLIYRTTTTECMCKSCLMTSASQKKKWPCSGRKEPEKKKN